MKNIYSLVKSVGLISISQLCLNGAVSAEPLQATVSKQHVKLGAQLSELFVLNGRGFLSEPLVAKLDTPSMDEPRDFYLVAIPFNVPALKNRWFVHYRFVRVSGTLSLDDGSRLRLLSIYPVNELLKAELENTKELEGTIKPEFNGAAGGSVRALNKDVTKYAYEIPSVAGTMSQFDDHSAVAWTYYPAKCQPVIFGNKVGYAVISVPRNTKLATLHFDAELSYELNLTVPPFAGKLTSSWSLPLSEAMTVSELTKLRFADMTEGEFKKSLLGAYVHSVPVPKFEFPKLIDGDITLDTTTGKMFRLKGDTLSEIQMPSNRSLTRQNTSWQSMLKDDLKLDLRTDTTGKLVFCHLTTKIPKRKAANLAEAQKLAPTQIILKDGSTPVVTMTIQAHGEPKSQSTEDFYYILSTGHIACTDYDYDRVTDWSAN